VSVPDTSIDRLRRARIEVELGAKTTQALLALFVEQCRADGHSWEDIGKALGTTRQAAWERYGRGPEGGGGA
jgi:hypothetical protein